MRRTMVGFLGIVALAFAGLGACGGKVVIDADGSGGAGSSSTGTNTGGMGGGSPQSLCEAACAKLSTVPACEMQEDCVEDCLSSFEQAGPCKKEFIAATECILENAGASGECVSSICDPLVGAFETCLNPFGSCQSSVCSQGEDGSCNCEGTCNGDAVATECFPQPGTTQVCVCSIDGIQVGKCEATLGTFACGVTEGCCAQFFLQ
ncbi:hypothetical protein [Polyangium sp. 15x6]|uniref:hypothetical protein n=1 Tax=Polyangium sp. 15x6 TaxID=3042687 RepID=UPI002499B095|nr:hypothetical protein [Polyangium sp. 15x6]MDI3289329.1 hypothetical protein [Polyangium sp. 15x6]